jgi:hypothetical protein
MTVWSQVSGVERAEFSPEKVGKHLVLILFVGLSIQSLEAGRTRTATDTLRVVPGQTVLELRHPFVIDSTFALYCAGQWVDTYTLDPITGRVTLPEANPTPYIATYEYLAEALPVQVGPLLDDLPTVDSLLRADSPADTDPLSITDEPPGLNSDLVSTGTIFRNLTISPFGGTDFSGGLQLQLQGKLTENIQVNGVLSDQSFPIQPEGNTQTLEEIDQVYLQVSHPRFTVTAGDIDFSIQQGKYLNIKRKLTGLKQDFNYNKWSGKAVYGGSQGRFHQLAFKGADGNQGPYFLTSENGSRDIIVLAGSERVWLDGQPMLRGENHDYIIDYNTGEITFTPRHTIYDDSDIYVEYQYSDFQYNQNVLGGSLERRFSRLKSGQGNIAVSWLKEFNPVSSEALGLTEALLDSLRAAGDSAAVISGARPDPKGEYVLENGVFVYHPDCSDTTECYSVTFQYDALHGSYIKRVSPEGKLYFEYVPETLRDQYQDRYSPVRRLVAPASQELLQAVSVIPWSDQVVLTTEVSLSNYDRNTVSPRGDGNNFGVAHRLELQVREIALPKSFRVSSRLVTWGQSENFHPLQREREVLFNRDWDLKNAPVGEERMLSGGLELEMPGFGQAGFDWSRYTVAGEARQRRQSRIVGSTTWFPKVELFHSRVTAPGGRFTQTRGAWSFLPGRLHPFLTYRGETAIERRFDHTTVGMAWEGERSQARLGIGKRIDRQETDSTRKGLELSAAGYFGELDWKHHSRRGWAQEIVLRKRINSNYQTRQKVDYELAWVNLRYFRPQSAVRWDFQGKLEESFTETRVVVYDSVGVGLGGYRFDPEYQEYVADPNGAYIAATVLIGDRRPVTRLEGLQRLYIDLEKSGRRRLRDLDLRLEFRTTFEGRGLTRQRLFNPGTEQTDISRARWNWRSEIDYNPPRSVRRVRQWLQVDRDLNGYDPRGSDLRRQWESVLEWYEPLRRSWQLVTTANGHIVDITSGIATVRDRSVEGWWLESGLQWQRDRDWQLKASLQGGADRGSHRLTPYRGSFRGIWLEILRFIGNGGRLQGRLELNQTRASGQLSSLPPEAVRGLAPGRSFRAYLQSHILIGNNLSLNLTVNYVNDQRYDRLITMTGEIRAYF